MQAQYFEINNSPIPFYFDDGHGDYNRSYERNDDDFDYADYSTDHLLSEELVFLFVEAEQDGDRAFSQ